MTWGARGSSDQNAERMSLRSRAANTALFKTRRTTVGSDSSTSRQSVEMHEAVKEVPKSRQMLEKLKQILAHHQLGCDSAPSARLSGASTPRGSGGMKGEDFLPRTPPPAIIRPDQSAASSAPGAAVMARPARGRVALRMQLMIQLAEQEEDTRYRVLCRQSEEWIRITQYNGTTLSVSQEQILEDVRIKTGIEIAANTALPRDSLPYNPPAEEESEAIRAELDNMQLKELRGLLRQSGQNPSGSEKTMRERLYQLMACGAIEPLQVCIQMKTECASPPRRSHRKHKNEESQALAPVRKSPSPEQRAVVFEVPSEEEVEAIRLTLNETAVKQLRVFMRERRLNPAGSAADLRDRLLKLISAGAAEPIPVSAAAVASAPEPPARLGKWNRNAESQPTHAPSAPSAPTQPPAEAWVQQHPQPSPADMQGMRRTLVSLPAKLLREKLRAAGLTPAGSEKDLRERLEKAVASGVAAPLMIMEESGMPPAPCIPQERIPQEAPAPPAVATTVVPVEEDTAPPSPKYRRPSAEELEEARQGITALPGRLLRERLRAAGLNPAGAESKLKERLFEAIGEGMAPLLKQKTPALQQRRLSHRDRNASSIADLGMSSEQKQPQFQQQQQQQQTGGARSTEEKVRALKEMTLNQLRPLLRKSGLNPSGSGESLRSRATDALRSGDLQLDPEKTQVAPPSPVNARVRRPPGGASSVCLF